MWYHSIMKDEKKSNKAIIIILASLTVVIIVLIAIITVVKLSQGNEGNDNSETDEDETTVDITVDEEALINKMDYINDYARKWLEEETIDVAKVVTMYDSLIEEVKQQGKTDYVVRIIMDRNDALLSKGLKQEALDALKTVDVSSFSEPDQYRVYTMIIDQAKELEDNLTVEEYTKLQEKVADAYWEDYKATEEALKKWEEEQATGGQTKEIVEESE